MSSQHTSEVKESGSSQGKISAYEALSEFIGIYENDPIWDELMEEVYAARKRHEEEWQAQMDAELATVNTIATSAKQENMKR